MGNSIADELADLGTRLEAQHRWWKRVQPMGEWEDGFPAKISGLQREKTPCEQALRIQWSDAVNFPRNDPTLQEAIPFLGAVTNTIAHAAAKWSSDLDSQDDTMIEMRRLCLERRREKDPVKLMTLSTALHRARQKMRRTQATLRCKEATQLGAPSRLKGPPPQTRAPILERVDELGRTEKVETLNSLPMMVSESERLPSLSGNEHRVQTESCSRCSENLIRRSGKPSRAASSSG